MNKCAHCGKVFPTISEEVFLSDEAKNGKLPETGVIFTEDAYASEIYGDETKEWECNVCYWKGWWDT